MNWYCTRDIRINRILQFSYRFGRISPIANWCSTSLRESVYVQLFHLAIVQLVSLAFTWNWKQNSRKKNVIHIDEAELHSEKAKPNEKIAERMTVNRKYSKRAGWRKNGMILKCITPQIEYVCHTTELQ